MEIREYTEYREEEILRLYTEVGWTAYTKDMSELEQGYKHSLLVLSAYENEELLGIVRAVGDGHTIVFVQDILVFPEKQRQGVGTALLTDNTPKTVAFYKSLGFSELSEIGCCGFVRC